MSDDWTTADEAADLVEKTAFEHQVRADRLGGLGDDEGGLDALLGRVGAALGFDGAVIARLAELVQSQETELQALRREVDELRGR